MPFNVGDLIDGHYRVEQRFAGGMGFVYVVLDEVVGKRFAIKQLSELHAEDKVLCERFRREASTWLLLDYHPHIVQAHSYLPRAEGPMIILEFVDGPSLDLLLRMEKKLCPAQALDYARQFCQGMSHAHTKVIPGRGSSVLHRDIKPGNLLITRTNRMKITDFGLAKIEGDSHITAVGQYVGTVAYSSPEQLRSAGEVTKAGDVYSFGAVLYQMLSGQPPFLAQSAVELYHLIQQTAPQPLAEICTGLNDAFARLVMQCLNKDAARRFGDFTELEFALGGFENAVRDSRDRACPTCGFLTRRRASKCSVCGGITDAERAKLKRRPGPETPRPTGHADVLPVPADLDSGAPALSPAGSALARSPEPASSWNLDAAKEYLVELRAGGKLKPWQLDRSGYTLGRDPSMKIRLEDPRVARYQLFLVRLPCGWLAMNPQPNSWFEVNGQETQQQVLRPADVLRVGDTWLAFAGPRPADDSLPPVPGHWAERAELKAQTVRSGGSLATKVDPQPAAMCVVEVAGGPKVHTQGQPLRIGTSPLCDVQLNDAAAAPVQAIVAWQDDGPHLIKLTGGLVKLMGGEEVTDRLLEDGDLVQVGSTPLRFRVDGDSLAPARLRATQQAAAPSRFGLTVLNGSQKGQTAVIPPDQTLVLGRHPDCDVMLASDPHISRRHLELTAGATGVEVKDCGSRSGFFLNQVHFANTAVARLGDVLVVGKTSVLLHYEIAGR